MILLISACLGTLDLCELDNLLAPDNFILWHFNLFLLMYFSNLHFKDTPLCIISL